MKKNYVGIREARINLSRLIRDVRGGMEVVITDRGLPVAKLIPAQGQSLSLEERINNYITCGLIENCLENNEEKSCPVKLPGDRSAQSFREEE